MKEVIFILNIVVTSETIREIDDRCIIFKSSNNKFISKIWCEFIKIKVYLYCMFFYYNKLLLILLAVFPFEKKS